MKAVNQHELPNVSFIVPTLNADFILERCLQAIRSQNYPKEKVEIVIADAGSNDRTLNIARRYKAKIISNPEILHEPGKARASQVAKGEILFFVDADNILVHQQWLKQMILPYVENPKVTGFLPQTEPPKDSSSLNQYLGYLFTDPFTWFVYGSTANPKDWSRIYTPLKKTSNYRLYRFSPKNPPLFGLSQGVGTTRSFQREKMGHNDDLLSGIKLIAEGGVIAYVPTAGVYHYHVTNFSEFLRKYRWRIRNNFLQKISGMGFVNREQFFGFDRRLRTFLFLPYSFSVFLPLFDAVRLSIEYRDLVCLWHVPACIGLSAEILYESVKYKLGITPHLSRVYGK